MTSGVMAPAKPGAGSSAALVKTAHGMTADLMQASPRTYWADLLASCAVGYGALIFAAYASAPTVWRVLAGLVAVVALYRAVMFIHELTHLKLATVPGFWTAWNVLVGIPLLIPSFFSEGVHNLHHAKTHYGTIRDPEYLPLGRSRPLDLIAFVLVSSLAPVGLIFRSLVLVPLSAVVPPLRKPVWERASSLVINPLFVRPPPAAGRARERLILDALTSLYAWAVLALLAAGVVTWESFAIAVAIGAGIALINQFRTLVAHHWENDDGHELDAVEQLLDTVNVPPPGMLPMLWAPVGLRYHGLHHFLPGMPYHNLGEAHRRMMALLPANGPYHKTSSRGAGEVIVRLLQHQAQVQAGRDVASAPREAAPLH